jgi:hypothetical protein
MYKILIINVLFMLHKNEKVWFCFEDLNNYIYSDPHICYFQLKIYMFVEYNTGYIIIYFQIFLKLRNVVFNYYF